jgi:hypothetical protein
MYVADTRQRKYAIFADFSLLFKSISNILNLQINRIFEILHIQNWLENINWNEKNSFKN